LPWDIDIPFASAFFVAIAITNWYEFFNVFGYFSTAFRICLAGFALINGIVWTTETALRLRRIAKH
jgi:hypothetical protein